MKNKMITRFILFLTLFVMTGCYACYEVQETEIGVRMPDGVTAKDYVTAGRYSDWGVYAEMNTISVAPITAEWSDESNVTLDKQPIGIRLGYTFRRNPGQADLLWRQYRTEARDDVAATQLVHNRLPRAVKAITTRYTLNQLLGIPEIDSSSGEITATAGREVVAQEMFDLVQAELKQVGLELLDLGINDISVSQSFKDSLDRKAQALAEAEEAKANQIRAEAELNTVKAENEITIERARAEAEINKALSETVGGPDRYFELIMLRERIKGLSVLGEVIGPNDKIIYVPAGSDVVNVLSGSDQPAPLALPDNPPTE